jgi:hypothetical protein
MLENETIPEHYYKRCFKVQPVVYKFLKVEQINHNTFNVVKIGNFKHRINLN